jgi:hypothetical protein
MNPSELAKIRTEYPKGTSIKLIEMINDPAPVPSGTIGTVADVDDAGSINVEWENGRTLAIILGIDKSYPSWISIR